MFVYIVYILFIFLIPFDFIVDGFSVTFLFLYIFAISFFIIAFFFVFFLLLVANFFFGHYK